MPRQVEVKLALLPRQARLLKQWIGAAEGNNMLANGSYYGMSIKESQEVQLVLDKLREVLV